jgi:hypothetical protein
MTFKDIRDGLSMLAYVVHALGFEMINSLLRNWNGPESPKSAMRKSFWIALSRSSIHFPPMLSLTAIIFVNYWTLYIGPGFAHGVDDNVYLALFQVAAKVQELLCVASMSAIVLQALRHELLGEGVPIGLLGSGIWFSQIGSFWSPEFLAATPFSFKGFGKFRLYLLLILAGAIAATIGPATAVLMLPRIQTMPAGGTNYFLNGTAEQFWPDVVTADSELDVCSLPNSTKYAVCPSGGYESLRLEMNGFNFSNVGGTTLETLDKFFAPNIQATATLFSNWFWATLLIRSPRSLIPPAILSARIRGYSDSTTVVHPHGPTIIVQQQLREDWVRSAAAFSDNKVYSLAQYRWTTPLSESSPTSSPWVRTRCSAALNITMEADQASFPYLNQSDGYTFWGHERLVNISSLNRTESSHLRTQWISLPIYNSVNMSDIPTSGLLFELPWVNGSRLAVGCAIAASWHKGLIYSDTSFAYYAWINKFGRNEGGAEPDSPDADQHNRPITLDRSWLDLLTPVSPADRLDAGTWTPNTLERLFIDGGYTHIINNLRTKVQPFFLNYVCTNGMANQSNTDTELWNDSTCNKGNKGTFMEFMIGAMVADGLSRYGTSRLYNVFPALEDWSLRTLPHAPNFNESLLRGGEAITMPSDPNIIVQRLTEYVEGYSYYASTTTDYLATSVACIYILLAGSHVVRLLYYRVSSSSWDTITELLLLCQSSPRSVLLNNTSTGIKCLKTYKTIVKIRAAPPENLPGESKLVLVLDHDTSKTKDTDSGPGASRLDLIEPDKKYS